MVILWQFAQVVEEADISFYSVRTAAVEQLVAKLVGARCARNVVIAI